MTSDEKRISARADLDSREVLIDVLRGQFAAFFDRDVCAEAADAILSSDLVVGAGAADEARAERDAALAAIREWSSAVDMFQRSFTVETSSRLLAAEDALRALLPPSHEVGGTPSHNNLETKKS